MTEDTLTNQQKRQQWLKKKKKKRKSKSDLKSKTTKYLIHGDDILNRNKADIYFQD